MERVFSVFSSLVIYFHCKLEKQMPSKNKELTIIHTFSIVLFPTERAQSACSHTCTCNVLHLLTSYTCNHMIPVTYLIN